MNGLEVIMVRRPELDAYDVYLGAGHHWATSEQAFGGPVYVEVPERAEKPLFLRLSTAEVEALARAILKQEHPEVATLDALKDARAVRDRLLTMFERRGIR